MRTLKTYVTLLLGVAVASVSSPAHAGGWHLWDDFAPRRPGGPAMVGNVKIWLEDEDAHYLPGNGADVGGSAIPCDVGWQVQFIARTRMQKPKGKDKQPLALYMYRSGGAGWRRVDRSHRTDGIVEVTFRPGSVPPGEYLFKADPAWKGGDPLLAMVTVSKMPWHEMLRRIMAAQGIQLPNANLSPPPAVEVPKPEETVQPPPPMRPERQEGGFNPEQFEAQQAPNPTGPNDEFGPSLVKVRVMVYRQMDGPRLRVCLYRSGTPYGEPKWLVPTQGWIFDLNYPWETQAPPDVELYFSRQTPDWFHDPALDRQYDPVKRELTFYVIDKPTLQKNGGMPPWRR